MDWSSIFSLLDARSLSGAASMRDLFKDLCPYEGSGKSAKFSFRDSLTPAWSFGEDPSALTLENVVKRAECGIDDAVGVDVEIGCEYAVKGVFLIGESVVNIGGVGAEIGTYPRLPCPGCDTVEP